MVSIRGRKVDTTGMFEVFFDGHIVYSKSRMSSRQYPDLDKIVDAALRILEDRSSGTGNVQYLAVEDTETLGQACSCQSCCYVS